METQRVGHNLATKKQHNSKRVRCHWEWGSVDLGLPEEVAPEVGPEQATGNGQDFSREEKPQPGDQVGL